MNPLVSILIPAHNAHQWITESIDSALAQTWARKEIIVVDDGSTDDTLEIVERYATRGVKVVGQANQGAAVARNTALAHSQGDYIQWLDADDILDPRKVESQVRALDGHGPRTLLSGAWGHFIYRQSKARFIETALWEDLQPAEWLVRKMGSNLQMQTDNWLVSRELTEAAGPWDCRLWRDNDGEYFCRVILASDGVHFVPEAKSLYRAAGFKSISTIAGSSKKLESLFLSMNLHIEYLRSLEDSERSRAACVQYIRNWLYEFYPFRTDLAARLMETAVQLGGRAEEPRLSWKYDWLVRCFGWNVGRQAQLMLPKLRGSVVIAWDRAMLEWESRT